jgi:SAM-dependent methyltransferase
MTMKLYEMGRLMAEPVLPPLYKHVRSRLRKMIRSCSQSPRILDVGGRKSPYTIGLQANITVIDLPRNSDVQELLYLGINEQIIGEVKQRRSNVENVVLGDMTKSDLPNESFDLAVSVEVIEHVEEDERFVSEISRVLKNGGIFLLTTPNGDWVENKNPDHKRHYRREELQTLLEKYFSEVHIDYAIAGGRYRKMGLKSWSLSKPTTIAFSIFGNIVNSIQSTEPKLRDKSTGTHHLIGVAKK